MERNLTSKCLHFNISSVRRSLWLLNLLWIYISLFSWFFFFLRKLGQCTGCFFNLRIHVWSMLIVTTLKCVVQALTCSSLHCSNRHLLKTGTTSHLCSYWKLFVKNSFLFPFCIMSESELLLELRVIFRRFLNNCVKQSSLTPSHV